MATSSSYAADARKQVGQFLVKQAGYSKKGETNFYKQGDNILTYISFQRSRGMTQPHVGIVPLYIPDSLNVLYTTNLTTELLPGCMLVEDDNMYKASAWADRLINYLNGDILVFMESLSSPQILLDYLKNRLASDRRFLRNPIQVDKLIVFSSAYLGKVSFAVEYAKAAQLKIQEERIDNLESKVARWDEEITKMRRSLAKNGACNKEYLEEQISAYEREKRLAIFDAENNAPSTIQMYGKWIAPFVVSGFNSEEYFAQIVEHNKACLKYSKLFSSKRH